MPEISGRLRRVLPDPDGISGTRAGADRPRLARQAAPLRLRGGTCPARQFRLDRGDRTLGARPGLRAADRADSAGFPARDLSPARSAAVSASAGSAAGSV